MTATEQSRITDIAASGEAFHRVAFLGLGNMGLPMAARLVTAGYTVQGFDLDPAARSAHAAAGGIAVNDPASAVDGADAVVLMLPNSSIVESVIDGLLTANALRPGSTVVDMSSSEPMSTRTLALRLAEMSVALVDAPVSGGVAGAEKGALTIMVGSAPDVFETVRPLLEHLGRPRRAGDVGAGHATKAINNLLSATHLLATAEGVRVGQEFGLDPDLLVEIIDSSSGRSGSTANKFPNFVLPETYNSGFGLRLMLKDMKIATDLARSLGLRTPLGDEAVALWDEAADALPPDADHTEVARWSAAQPVEVTTEVARGSIESDSSALRKRIEAIHGEWSDDWQAVLDLRPEFLAAYTGFAGVPVTRDALGPKTRELVYLAVDAAATHLHAPGIRQHVRAALAAGATPDEVMEVIELSSTVGVHALNIGVPVLVEVLRESGQRTGPAPFTPQQEELRRQFTEQRGYWHAFWEEMLELDPEIFAGYTEFSSVSWRTGTLPPKVKEFVYIAFDAAATHLYVPGLRLHIQNALGYGASTEEILEILEIAAVMGMQSATTAFPIIADELARRTDGGNQR
ncbi:NAD(P)-binding domain-containing protein [Rhodococcus sp. NCIMB 12038]|uniref:NAD(P)-binding domain-containing protein n=1 Tax=Rhodococcus sp. NCIMB 12038 TaxID=933800 RepID=UPI000B3D236B|nr:NAD(P)-binding domain-containing protein [Rhodococcus sp. NCIMB 12038]OUS91371.1 carboxymuconolactone decarboxylase [Rhodococcus sp. NCIMB 12038]